MNKGQKTTFKNKQTLYEMLNLRRNGYGVMTLAIMYNCDISSIRYQCDKYQIEPLTEAINIEYIISRILPPPAPVTFKVVNGEKVNLGRAYADYFK